MRLELRPEHFIGQEVQVTCLSQSSVKLSYDRSPKSLH
jgi:hypothetical protein